MGNSLHHNTFKAFNIKIKVFYLNSFRKIYLISHFILIGERLDVTAKAKYKIQYLFYVLINEPLTECTECLRKEEIVYLM
jgi:hypothetical protein